MVAPMLAMVRRQTRLPYLNLIVRGMQLVAIMVDRVVATCLRLRYLRLGWLTPLDAPRLWALMPWHGIIVGRKKDLTRDSWTMQAD